MIKVDVLTREMESAYEDFVGECSFGLVQHGISWRAVICNIERDEPFFIVAKEDDKIVGALPLYYHKCRLGSLLTTTPRYTVSGIICSKETECREIYKALFDHAVSLSKELDCTVLSIASNPFLNDKELYLRYFEPDYVMQNFIQYVNLREIFDGNGDPIRPDFFRSQKHLARNLRKALKQPINISEEQTQNNVDKWTKIYKTRMKELGANAFSQKCFNSILNHLILEGKGKFFFAFYKGTMIGGSLLLYNRNMSHAYMMSMDYEYAGLRTNYLLGYRMMEWSHKNHIPIFDWMSSPKRGDGVYSWKAQWGSHEGTCLYLTRVLGDISHWKKMDYTELSKAYKFHYLLPFNLLNSKSKFTTKDELSLFLQSSLQNK